MEEKAINTLDKIISIHNSIIELIGKYRQIDTNNNHEEELKMVLNLNKLTKYENDLTKYRESISVNYMDVDKHEIINKEVGKIMVAINKMMVAVNKMIETVS